MAKIYTVDYFINKFEAIPENEWTTGTFKKFSFNDQEKDKFCVLGFCLEKEGTASREYLALRALDSFSDKAKINDGDHIEYQQPTPKQRILAYLKDIKAELAELNE